MKYRTLGEVSLGRDNTFDFLRFFLASLVILSHSYAMLYNGTREGYDPLLRWTNGQAAFGGVAVDGFFLISGFLITKSWLGSKSAGDYAKKRALRILPALVVVLIVTVLVIGPLSTTLPLTTYFRAPHTWAYFGFMGTINLHLTDRLPGVFAHNPLAYRVNGSLWTIRCEVICYLMVAALGLLRFLRHPRIVLALSAATILVMFVGAKHMMTLGEFADSFRVTTYFLWGMTFYLYRDVIPHTRALLLGSLVGIFASGLLGILPYTLPVLGAYALFYAAFRPKLGMERFAKHGDFSYGLYLYAFPVQQLLVTHFRPLWNAGTLTLAAFVAAGACAVGSWYLVEKHWLKQKRSPSQSVSFEQSPEKSPAIVVAGQTGLR